VGMDVLLTCTVLLKPASLGAGCGIGIRPGCVCWPSRVLLYRRSKQGMRGDLGASVMPTTSTAAKPATGCHSAAHSYACDGIAATAQLVLPAAHVQPHRCLCRPHASSGPQCLLSHIRSKYACMQYCRHSSIHKDTAVLDQLPNIGIVELAGTHAQARVKSSRMPPIRA